MELRSLCLQNKYFFDQAIHEIPPTTHIKKKSVKTFNFVILFDSFQITRKGLCLNVY